MRTWLLFIGMVWCIMYDTIAQPCKKITIDNVSHKKILTDFIEAAVKKGFFVGDKGVVEVNRFTRNGRLAWLIKATIEDKYKDNPPLEWASLESDVILFYDTNTSLPNASMHDVVKHESTPELLSCLAEAIEDRLYSRPPRVRRSLDSGFISPSGKPIMINAHRQPESYSLVIIFEADGSITKLHPV